MEAAGSKVVWRIRAGRTHPITNEYPRRDARIRRRSLERHVEALAGAGPCARPFVGSGRKGDVYIKWLEVRRVSAVNEKALPVKKRERMIVLHAVRFWAGFVLC